MAEIAGLALGAAGITALFGTCIKCFDIVVDAREFSEDYEQLCTLVSFAPVRCLQTLRLFLLQAISPKKIWCKQLEPY